MEPSNPQHLQLTEHSWLRHVPAWAHDADVALSSLTEELAWKVEYLNLYGRVVPQPRLTAVCGRSMDPATRYRRPNPVQPWSPVAGALRSLVAAEVPGWEPNGLIANRYRDGADSISWHADDEPALGPSPVVASVSFGARRGFRLKPRSGGPAITVDLSHGDLLIMGGATQQEYVHAIAKSKRVNGPRVSLTFRRYL